MFMISIGTHIKFGQTGHLTILSLHLIHGIGTDGTHGRDGDIIDGGVTTVVGMQILGITIGINMDIVDGMDMTLCYGVVNGIEEVMPTMHILMAQEAAELI